LYGHICLVGDPHLGNVKFPYGDDPDLVTRIRVQAFRDSIQYCLGKRCKYMVVLGDMFDSKSLLVHPSIIKDLRNMLRYGAERGMQYTIIAGNHDVSSKHESSLWYIDAPMVNIIYKPCIFPIIGALASTPYIAVVPYMYHTTAKESLLSLSFSHTPNILIGHFSVHKQDSQFYIKNDPWSVDLNWLIDYCVNRNINTVVLGHQHNYFKYERGGVTVCCLGALSPTSRSQQGYDYGNIAFTSLLKPKLKVYKGAIGGYRYVTTNNISNDNKIMHLLVNVTETDLDNCTAIGAVIADDIEEQDDLKYDEDNIFDAVFKAVLENDELLSIVEANSLLTDTKYKEYESLEDPFSLV